VGKEHEERTDERERLRLNLSPLLPLRSSVKVKKNVNKPLELTAHSRCSSAPSLEIVTGETNGLDIRSTEIYPDWGSFSFAFNIFCVVGNIVET